MRFSITTTFIFVIALYSYGIYAASTSGSGHGSQVQQIKHQPPGSQHGVAHEQHQSGIGSSKPGSKSMHSTRTDPSLVDGIAKAIEVVKNGEADIHIAFGTLGDGYAYRFNLSTDGAALAVVDFQGTFVLAILPKDLRSNHLRAYYDFFLVQSKKKPGQTQLAVVVKDGNHDKVLYIAFKKDVGSNSAVVVEKSQDKFAITANRLEDNHFGRVHISTYRGNVKYDLHVTESRELSRQIDDDLLGEVKLEMKEANKNNEPGPFYISVVKASPSASAAIKATSETVVH